MSVLTLHRKSNLMLMGRKFNIYIDGELYDKISNGETMNIELPENSKALTVKVMSYESKPINLNLKENESYSLKQNLISDITTYLMVLFGALFFFFDLVLEKHQPIFLYCSALFVIFSMYYSTLGRRNVLILEKIIVHN